MTFSRALARRESVELRSATASAALRKLIAFTASTKSAVSLSIGWRYWCKYGAIKFI